MGEKLDSSTSGARPTEKRPQAANARRSQRATYVVKVGALLSLCLLCLLWPQLWQLRSLQHTQSSSASAPGTKDDWSWEAIEPSKSLVWHPCFDELDCSRLSVPLDWLDPTDERRVVLALIRKNATATKNYLGPLFVNPGGPGGSGVEMVKSSGSALQVIVGANHDIIGFDPRGMGATTPQAHCWSRPQEEQIWGIEKLGLIDAHEGMIYDLFAKQSLVNANCEVTVGDFTRFMGTTSVARDMLEILNQLEGLEGNLRYFGLSYGTVLGGTFAAMFPDRIERMVNDGNVNLNEWYNGTGIHFCDTTDAGVLAFFDFCHQAGADRCKFHASSPSAISNRLTALYSSLHRNPVQVLPSNMTSTVGFKVFRPELITYSDVKYLVVMSLYRPIQFWPPLASILLALESGNGLPFLKYATENGYRSAGFTCSCELDDPSGCKDNLSWPLVAEGNSDGANLVKCGEGPEDHERDKLETLMEYADKLEDKAPLSASVMFQFRLGCAGWQSRAKWRFDGPWSQNTSYPILFIGNTFDNITPLSSAIYNSRYFPGSVVLEQNSYGHTSVSTPSGCTAKRRLEYFQTGKLPQAGTFCDADITPFGEEVSLAGSVGGMEWALRKLGDLEIGRLF